MKIAVCAICRNELPYIDEWISFYKTTGFDSIFIYDNVSDDGTSERLQKLDASGIINRVFWPRIENIPPQRSAYSHFLDNHASEFDFVLICDIDEFLLTPNYDTKKFLSNALLNNPRIGAIAVPWLIFGSSGEEKYIADNLVKRFQHCANKTSPVVKTIFRPSFTQNIRTHICDLFYGDYLNGDLDIANWHEKHPHWVTNNSENGAVLFHYYTKSREEFTKRRTLPKADRAGLVSRNMDEFDEYSSQTRYNPTAYKLNTAINLTKNNINNRLISSYSSNISIDCIDFDNGWFFGVIHGESSEPVKINILINNDTEISKIINLRNNNSTPFSLKLKWARNRPNSLYYNINGLRYNELNLLMRNNKKIENFEAFCQMFPSAEEHILSLFISLVSKENAEHVKKIVKDLDFQKYTKHQVFSLLICEWLISDDFTNLSTWIDENTEYKPITNKLKN